MIIYGYDFTSAPRPAKPITCARCVLENRLLQLEQLDEITSFEQFEASLHQPGSWVAGLDFPFGQPRKLVEALGWPQTWEGYVDFLATISKKDFEQLLAKYRDGRPPGDKQHLRRTDELAGSKSPMMLYGVPVGKMFFEGAPRLLASGACIRPCRPNGDLRIIVEAYPALVARKWAGRRSYKADERRKHTAERQSVRGEILRRLRLNDASDYYGFAVHASDSWTETMIQDGSGDQLDAFLCAIQAAWGYLQPNNTFGIPAGYSLEGWIVDPAIL